MEDVLKVTMEEFWDHKVNCARTTACGILRYNGKADACEIMYKAFLPFGGGIGEKSICGSITGALSAMSIVLAEKGLDDEKIMEKLKEFKAMFREEYDTLECKDILAEFKLEDGSYNMDDPGRREACTKSISKAVAIAQKIIDSV